VAINFPTSLDNFTNPVSGNTLDSPSHSLQHSDINDAVEAMQRKVGVGSAVAGSASAGQVLTISAAGTSTWSTPSAAGLTLINTTSFSGVSSVSLPNGTLTTTYTNYRFLVDITSATSDNTVNLRLRSGGSDIASGTIYSYAYNGHNSLGGNDPTASSGANQLFIAEMDSASASEYTASIIEIFNPMTASKRKIGLVQTFYTNNAASAFISRTGGCFFNTTTACDSISLIPTAGNFSGIIRVYGYNV
jgi:hypothetical protein